VGPAQHQFLRCGVSPYRHARPSCSTEGDGIDDGTRLAPPFRGITNMSKGKRYIIAGHAAGSANSNPMTKRTMGERATEDASCPATSVLVPAMNQP
jgi:hypothetical protein